MWDCQKSLNKVNIHHIHTFETNKVSIHPMHTFEPNKVSIHSMHIFEPNKVSNKQKMLSMLNFGFVIGVKQETCWTLVLSLVSNKKHVDECQNMMMSNRKHEVLNIVELGVTIDDVKQEASLKKYIENMYTMLKSVQNPSRNGYLYTWSQFLFQKRKRTAQKYKNTYKLNFFYWLC